MSAAKNVMKMPELFVFARFLAIGFIAAEVWRVAFSLGENFAPKLHDVALWIVIIGIGAGLLLCLIYIVTRGAHSLAARMFSSARIDLLLTVAVGVWVDKLASPWLTKIHTAVAAADPNWAPALLLFFSAMLLSPLVQQYRPRARVLPQLYFLADIEVSHKDEDLLTTEPQAESFAKTVLASGAHAGLVFGVDGPWGVGKTSFINLTEQYWTIAPDKPIVCRFEPLRYASEPDLADRLIKDLSATIQREVFAPEFRPAASRYSRLLKGKADFSFLGFKLSLEPSQETMDELLEDIDEVLRRIERRVIIVIDDLDRLDAKTINSVLFATRRTFKLSRATYILCYDTEILAGGQEEGTRAREFLEKFVTVKLSLFVDSSGIKNYLERDWQSEGSDLGSIPADTLFKLGAVLGELGKILDGNLAPAYLPLVGNLRKVKRFFNAMLLMQLERSDLTRTDFNKRDLINLILIHLHYPGLFRTIYAEETERRSGTFSLQRAPGKRVFRNSDAFSNFVESQPAPAQFLLNQLFNVGILELPMHMEVDEATLATRACFNSGSYRNLENYLKLIVRFATPEPQKTYILYSQAVEKVRGGESIAAMLRSSDFKLEQGEHSHDQFWRLLVNNSYVFSQAVADDAINTLIDFIPKYSPMTDAMTSLRQRSIYSLLHFLDRAGWGRSAGSRRLNTPENIREIASRIFGERDYKGKGIIDRLASAERGVLGWNDLMLFRLQCSADRQGQLHNLQSALVQHEDPNAPTTGYVNALARLGMRALSQHVFALFKSSYIDQSRNFFDAVNNIPDSEILGTTGGLLTTRDPATLDATTLRPLSERIASTRSSIKSFVIYQLSNSLGPTGSGIGCGFYDAQGTGDTSEIAKVMNEYVFEFCFNPDLQPANAHHFTDHCLASLSNSFFTDSDQVGFIATKSGLVGGFDARVVGNYWARHQVLIRQANALVQERLVSTINYRASYSEDLEQIYSVLDELAADAARDVA
ncbi:KAP P-loop protein [Pseudomonas syringae]|uniref:KAP family NTPase n=1 Tax=Pseudomonas syringae TaxID=317 RepID=UPI000C070539|nr:KAP family NTPase [Pseudomonas syringae]MCF8985806.1 KAP P-loop protein [Pseudomonas syringae]